MIVVLAEYNTSRLRYILSEILERRLGIAFTITTNAAEFAAVSAGLKLNYTATPLAGSIQIVPQGLLASTDIRAIMPETCKDDTWHTLLWPSAGDVPFDLLAASFFLLSRYEEYTDNQRDEHGRFEARNSIAFQQGFLQIPIVDLWVDALKKVLQQHQPSITFRSHSFTSLSTLDIDFAYLYKGIGWKRWMGKLLRSMLAFNMQAVATQLRVTTGSAKDPYDTYDQILDRTKGNVACFMLMNGSGGYDKASDTAVLGPLIGRLKKRMQFIGIHPSYASNTRKELLAKETAALSAILNEPVTHSRQHFLKLEPGTTYRQLSNAGIRHDYTMLYAEQAGFRAGTCFPFLYYDLQQESVTALTLHSTCAMDVTLQNYMGLTPEKALELLLQLRESIRRYQGDFITLWHNNSLSEQQPEDWRNVYFSIFSPLTTEQI